MPTAVAIGASVGVQVKRCGHEDKDKSLELAKSKVLDFGKWAPLDAGSRPTSIMPRSTRRVGGSGLWALPDDGEAQLRAAARRQSQQFAADDDGASTEVEGSPPVIGDVDVADPMAAGAADEAHGDEEEVNDDEEEEDDEDEDADDDEEDDGEEQVQVLDAVAVDGPMAREEDQAAMAAAEEAADAADAAAAAAAAVMAAVGEDNDEDEDDSPPAHPVVQRANVRPHNRVAPRNDQRANRRPAVQVPVRRRKVLR